MLLMSFRLLIPLLLCLPLSAPVLAAPSENPAATIAASDIRYSPTELQADLQSLQEFVARTHPEPGFSADPQALQTAWAGITSKLNHAMTRQEFWREIAIINPLLNDAHWLVGFPYEPQPLATVLQSGAAVFPFEVHLTSQGELQILSATGGDATPWQGAQLLRINGVPAQRVVSDMLARMHGDTAEFRANLAATRFALLYWRLFGTPTDYTLELLHNGERHTVQQAGSRQLPRAAAQAEQFAAQFRFEPLPGKAALLKLGTFSWPDSKAFATFTEQAFAALKADDTETLIIDIRANRGGDDALWLDNVLPYIADKPYRTGSSWRKKVIAARASGTEKVGEVITGEISNWRQPQLEHPLRFRGRVFVLIGRETYSSAVLFSNVMQDFGFATLVGEAGTVRSRSSGGIQFHTLPNSGLEVVVPRFILARPAGDSATALIKPDWLLADDPADERALIDAVLARVSRDVALAMK